MSDEMIAIDQKPPLKKWIPLSFQHVFAMFGATVLVPLLTGLNPSAALLTSGLGTMLYILITGGKVPCYLGSSFAFIAPIIAVSSSYGVEYALGGAIGACIMAMPLIGIASARWNTDWRFLFLGVILLLAVVANRYIRTKAEAIRR